MPWKTEPLAWVEIHWPRPLDAEAVSSLLTRLSTIDRYSQIVFEVRAKHGRIHYLLGAEVDLLKRIQKVMHGELAGVRFTSKVTRADMTVVRNIRLSRPSLALNTDDRLAAVRSILATMAQTRRSGDESVIQTVLGASFTPSLLPSKLSDPTASWLDAMRGSVAPASSESRSLMKDKAAHHGFAAAVRIGAVAAVNPSRTGRTGTSAGTGTSTSTSPSPHRSLPRALGHVRSVFCAVKVIESAGVRLRATADKPRSLNLAKRPWFYQARLSVKELMGILAWPLGDGEFRGLAGLHPKLLLAPAWYKGERRAFGLASGFAGSRVPLGISARDSLEHTILLGPTGSGKSTAMLNLILADVNAGRSLLVIDPKADLVRDVLERIPESRMDDVVVLDPTDGSPVGFNPLIDKTRNPSLVADSVLAVLRDVFRESWGIRTQDVLSAALLTLVRYGRDHGHNIGRKQNKNQSEELGGKVSLVWLPPLLTDAAFRRKVVSKVAADDPLGLGAFWAGFEAMGVAERNQVIAPVMNKLRQFLLRPELRAVLGQTEPGFSLSDLLYGRGAGGKVGTGRKIVLVPLNKGVIGSEAARLLGSLIVGQLWTLALGRAEVSPEQRHIVSVFIDEVQDYLSLPTDLGDALSQARGLGVGLTLAHQYRAQLPPSLKAGIDANARNKIVFGLNATDAGDMAAMAGSEKLEALDFQLLPRFGVYASLQHNGRSTGWVSGSTLSAPPSVTSAAEVKAGSMERYGQDAGAQEREFLELMGHKVGSGKDMGSDTLIGRKRREASSNTRNDDGSDGNGRSDRKRGNDECK